MPNRKNFMNDEWVGVKWKISDQERGVIGERDIDGGYNIDLMDEI